MVDSIKVACSKNNLSEIRIWVNKTLKQLHITEKDKITLILAVDEVCANLMIHSHQCNPKEYIELKIESDEKEQIAFEISDTGKGFDIKNYKEPAILDLLNSKKKGGIGLMLVRRIMDEVSYFEEPNRNVYRLVKRIPAAS